MPSSRHLMITPGPSSLTAVKGHRMEQAERSNTLRVPTRRPLRSQGRLATRKGVDTGGSL